MKLFGLAGWSGAGKTTLVVRLLPALAARGLTVSTMKHAHHSFDIDQPGKDSFRHRAAGATEVALVTAGRYAIVREQGEATLAEVLARLAPADLVLVEGFKREPHPKLEIHRVANGKPLLHPGDRIAQLTHEEGVLASCGWDSRLNVFRI